MAESPARSTSARASWWPSRTAEAYEVPVSAPRPRREQNAERREHPEDGAFEREPEPVLVHDECRSKADDQCKPGAAAEREVHRGNARTGSAAPADGARCQSLSTRREPEREEEADDREDPEPVPVPIVPARR